MVTEIGVELDSAAEEGKTADGSSHSSRSETIFDLLVVRLYSVGSFSECWITRNERSRGKKLLGSAVEITSCESRHPATMEGIDLVPPTQFLGFENLGMGSLLYLQYMYATISSSTFMIEIGRLRHMYHVVYTNQLLLLAVQYVKFGRHTTPPINSTPG